MSTKEAQKRPALILYCALAQAYSIHAGSALAMFRRQGGHIADSVFYDAWRIASGIPEAFGMDGITYAARYASEVDA